MTARIKEQDSQTGSEPFQAGDGRLRARATLLGHPPQPIEIGAGAVILLDGILEATGPGIDRLRIRVGDLEQDVEAFGVAPPAGEEGSRWWASFGIPASAARGPAPVALVVDGGAECVEIDLGSLDLIERLEEPGPAEATSTPRIAICMATYEPDREQLRRQIDSIRGQTRDDWICLISDDASSPAAFSALEEVIGDDLRFAVSRSPRRLGFLRNFERSLRMLPPEIELVAFSDQDDRWDDDKLEALVAVLDANPAAALAYSDMRIATGGGEILSDTYWYLRRNSHNDIASMIVANTVTGAASMFRRPLLNIGLPFPPGNPREEVYHDHWLALCALAQGEIAYLDRPTYDYVRHAESITIRAQSEWLAPPQGLGGRARLSWRRLTRRLRMGTARPSWRSVYLGRYLLIRQLAAMLELRLGAGIASEKRRAIRQFARAERSPRAGLWLLARSLRPLIGRNETLARERILLGGLLWRWAALRGREAHGLVEPEADSDIASQPQAG